VQDWNQYLTQDSQSPRFATSTTSGQVVVSDSGSSSSQWCGLFEGTGGSWIKIIAESNCQINAGVGPWSAAFRQELAGILGWDESVETKRYLFKPGMTTLCMLYIDSTRTLNQQVCAHEADGAILAYRGLESSVAVADSFFADTLYMHTRLKFSGVVRVNDTITVVADTFYSGGFGSGGMPAMQQASGHIPVAKSAGNGAVWWSSTQVRVLHSLGNGSFRADSAGTAFVKAGPSASPSTRTRWWLPMKERGDSIHITVIEGLPFQVDSIGTDQMPITVATYHTFTARVVSQPPGSLSTRWIITDSRTPSQSDTITVSGNTLSRFIEEGSYAISFTVRPMVGSTIGFAATQDIPVCASPSENLWGGGKQGGGATNAIPGCETYEW
jgi:hypothetical protein